MTNKRKFKNAVYEQLARVGKALASGHRLELLDLLGQRPRTVEALAAETDMSVANASQHLKALRAAGLVEASKEGLFVTYRLAGDDVAGLSLALRRVAETNLAEVERVTRAFFAADDGAQSGSHEAHEQPEAIDRRRLLARAQRGEVVMLDVRPVEEYELAHLPGAVSVPLPELVERIAELPRRKEIVAYCRGPYCVLAVEAVRLLRARGYRARRLDDGVREWRARGLAVERPRRAKGVRR